MALEFWAAGHAVSTGSAMVQQHHSFLRQFCMQVERRHLGLSSFTALPNQCSLRAVNAELLAFSFKGSHGAIARAVAIQAGSNMALLEILQTRLGQAFTEGCIALQQVLLVVILSIVECGRRKDLGGNSLLYFVLVLLQALLSHHLLLVVMIEDGRHILSLAARSWIMEVPEHVKEVFVVGLCRVIFQLDSLCMVTQFLVVRVLRSSARVPNTGANNPRGAAELRLGEPESC